MPGDSWLRLGMERSEGSSCQSIHGTLVPISQLHDSYRLPSKGFRYCYYYRPQQSLQSRRRHHHFETALSRRSPYQEAAVDLLAQTG
jgi:hypothetical protein